MAFFSRIDDRLLWLGFGIFFYVATKGIRYGIKDVISLTELETLPDERKVEIQDLPENNLSIETLRTLSESPNANIANSAIQLVIERFLHVPNTYRTVLNDINQSRDETLRARAKQALVLLRGSPVTSAHPELNPPPWSPLPLSSDTPPSLPALEEAAALREVLVDRLAEITAGTSEVHEIPGEVVPSVENPVAGWTNVPRERPGLADDSEVERRRRRREAIVLREGEGGAVEADIIRFERD